MRASALVVALLSVAAGCLRDTQFKCDTNADCTLANQEGGLCESNGFCSFPDSNCVTGRHYGDHSGSLSNFCVSPDDGGFEGNANCSPAFQTLPGTSGHLYQVFATPSDFMAQRGTCSVQGPASYLAIPDDASELQAIVTASAAPLIWVGLTDEVVEGQFLTVRGELPLFLPFGAGQPDDAPPGEDCIAAMSGQIEDRQCIEQLPAVCECEP